MLKKLSVVLSVLFLMGQAHAGVNVTGTYFDKFIYQTDGDCKQIDTVWFHSTATFEPATLGNDLKGRTAIAKVAIQLFQDGTYYAQYQELAIKQTDSTGTSYDNIFEKTFSGNWSATADQIDVQGLGVGTPSKSTLPSGNVVDAINFKVTSLVNDPRAVNNAMNIVKSTTNNGPRGISINQFCGVN